MRSDTSNKMILELRPGNALRLYKDLLSEKKWEAAVVLHHIAHGPPSSEKSMAVYLLRELVLELAREEKISFDEASRRILKAKVNFSICRHARDSLGNKTTNWMYLFMSLFLVVIAVRDMAGGDSLHFFGALSGLCIIAFSWLYQSGSTKEESADQLSIEFADQKSTK